MYEYTVDAVENVPEIVSAQAGRLNGGDFEWVFTEEDDASYSVDVELKEALRSYTSKLVSVGGNGDSSSSGNTEETSGSEEASSSETKESEESKETEETKETSESENTEESEAVVEGTYVQNFTTDGMDSDFFEITGNLSTSKGTVTYQGLTLTQCLKIESSTNISFKTTSDAKLTLVFNETFAKNIKIDGNKVAAENGLVTVPLSAGTHTITKGDTANLYYMSVAVEGSEETTESTETEESTETTESTETKESTETTESTETEESTETTESTEETKEPEEESGYKSGKDYIKGGNTAPSEAVKGDVFVRPGANGTGKSFEDPTDLVTALTAVSAGNTIWMEAEMALNWGDQVLVLHM